MGQDNAKIAAESAANKSGAVTYLWGKHQGASCLQLIVQDWLYEVLPRSLCSKG